jgi:tetratricopeptide (TPR) repeat protein
LPGAGWTYTLVSANENRSAAIELANSKLSVRETSGQYHVQSNHYISNPMLRRNLDINATINEDTRARYKRTHDLLTGLDHPADATTAVKILADKTDPLTNQISGIGNVIATHMTVTSAVFDTAKQSVFLANGLAPTALTTFVEFPSIERFDPESFQDESYETITENDYSKDYPAISAAEQLYIEAKNAYEIELNRSKALAILESVTQTDPDAVAYQYMTGLMAIKVQEYRKAQNYLSRCQEAATGHYKLACQYYLARTRASIGMNEEAIQGLQNILNEADPKTEGPLIRATSKNLKKLRRTGFLRLNPDTLGIFMPEADVLAY